MTEHPGLEAARRHAALAAPHPDDPGPEEPDSFGRRARIEWASSIEPKQQKWLWDNRIPIGTASAWAGRGGTGKTTYLMHKVAELSRGTLPGQYYGTPQRTLIWSGEDAWGPVLVPRLLAAGADLDLVGRLVIDSHIDGNTSEVTPLLPLDTSVFREAIVSTKAVAVVIDPIASTMGGDLHREADVRSALDALARIADDTNAVVMFVRHFGKGSGNASDKMSGSHAFRDAVRSVFLFAPDGDRVVVTQDKGNYAPPGQESFAFRLENTEVPVVGGVAAVARVVELGASDTTVDDIINRSPERDEDHDDLDEVDQWLTKLLESGPLESSEVYKSADAAGLSKDKAKRAKKRIGVNAYKSSGDGPWFWKLQTKGAETKGASPTPGERAPLLPCTSEGVHESENRPREQSAGECSLGPSDSCRHCAEPLVYDDDKRDGYHSSKTACVKAQQTHHRAQLTVVDGKASCLKWFAQHLAELRAAGQATVESSAVIAAGEALGYGRQSIISAAHKHSDVRVIARSGTGTTWSIDPTVEVEYKPVGEWVDAYLDALPTGTQVVDRTHLRQHGEAAGYTWPNIRNATRSHPRIEARPALDSRTDHIWHIQPKEASAS